MRPMDHAQVPGHSFVAGSVPKQGKAAAGGGQQHAQQHAQQQKCRLSKQAAWHRVYAWSGPRLSGRAPASKARHYGTILMRHPPGSSPFIGLGMGLSHRWSGSLISTYLQGSSRSRGLSTA